MEFLLQSELASRLYHEHAERQPIIDYHCHLSPKMIADDYRFKSITELWLGGDHYKWRAMRANGVNERFITGDASDWEKFEKWAETVPYTLRNPLYHWTHMELRSAFGINKVLNPQTAREIFDACNEMLQEEGFTARGLMRHYGVEMVSTTDDPIDTLEYHEKIGQEGFEIKVLPAWRPDKAMAVGNATTYNAYVDKLSAVCNRSIDNYNDLLVAMQQRHDYFAAHGCCIADHGVSEFPWMECTRSEACEIFQKVRQGKPLEAREILKFQTAMLLELARMNARKGWVQQFHFGPLRNVNSRLYRKLGPDIGCDTMGDWLSTEALASFMDALDSEGLLAKTILYNINPTANSATAAMIANFQDGITPGKMQWGAGWWFNDQLEGMRMQINTLSLQGLLSRFVGMLTDSRSFLSYPRHDYFRRLLCDMLAEDVNQGLIPMEEMPRVEQMVEDICYRNAKTYFNL